MPKLHIVLAAAGFAAAALVAGCSEFGMPAEPPPPFGLGGYLPWTLHQSPEQIALRWYPDATPIVAPNEAARLHCQTWGRTAELISDTRDGSAEIAEYRCR